MYRFVFAGRYADRFFGGRYVDFNRSAAGGPFVFSVHLHKTFQRDFTSRHPTPHPNASGGKTCSYLTNRLLEPSYIAITRSVHECLPTLPGECLSIR